MRAHGDTLQGHEVVPFQGLWETVAEWTNRKTPREQTFIFVATLTALLGVGLLIYGFHEALQAIETNHLPAYWSIKPF